MGIFSKKIKDIDKDKAEVKPVEKKAVKRAEQKETAVKTDQKSMKKLYGEESEKKISKSEAKTDNKKIDSQAYRIIVKPLITEKAANVGVENKYVFQVSGNANKIEIAKAVADVYGIKPLSVNVVSVKGKKVRSGRHFGQRKSTKKAIVTLPKGKTINIYEGV